MKRLFRKVDNKSSQYDNNHPGTVRRDGSYIYEEFLTTGALGATECDGMRIYCSFGLLPKCYTIDVDDSRVCSGQLGKGLISVSA